MRIFTLILITFALGLAAPQQARADKVRQGGHFGLGIGGGSGVSGLSMKYFMADAHALQAVIGIWGHAHKNDTAFAFSGDYLFEGPALLNSGALELGWNIGLGPFLGIRNDIHLGIHGVLGLEFNIDPVPLDIVIEYRPGILIIPDVKADLISFTAHIRYYF